MQTQSLKSEAQFSLKHNKILFIFWWILLKKKLKESDREIEQNKKNNFFLFLTRQKLDF